MNKTRFRIIFNQARGMLMAVAEHIASAGKSVRASVAATSALATRQATNTTVTLKPTHFAVLCHLGLVSFVGLSVFANPAHADIIADKSAPKNQQATVLSAPNGVPLVNIQTPSAAGVSRNTYSQFDVNTNGAILNNSRTNVQTQLGGWVQGNPSLATGNARIILNEVNSNNPSLLNGYVEVAGSRAQVVIANPAGISCNGCGFINASRATLTTGTPIMNNGDLMGYRVGGGVINFLGAGLDTANSNYTDIIARAVNVNAGLWAQNLNIITGSNQVNVASNGDIAGITPISPNATLPDGSSNPAPGFAIDVAALGGMYAGKIHMIGTEAGLGVRNAGSIGASVGEVHIDANGMLTNTSTGRMTSAGNTQVTTTNGISNQGTIYAQGNTMLTTSGDLTNTGMIAALGDTTLAANGANSHIDNSASSVVAAGLNTDGSLNTGTTGNLSLAATQSITAFGQNLSAGDQTITAQSLDLSGSSTVGRNLTLTASNGNLNTAGAILAANGTFTASTTQTLITDAAKVSANQINLAAHDLSNVAGELVQTGTGDTTINLAGDLNNNQGRIATNSNNLTLAAQTLTNTSGNGNQASIEHAGTGKLGIMATTYNGTGGLIQSNGVLDFKATTATLDNGSTVAKQISMDTATLSNKNGEIIQTGTGTTAIKATTKLDNTGGVIASNGNTTLAVGDLVNQGGAIQAANTANLTVNATGAINNKALNSVAGSLQAGGAAIINAGSIDNRQGQVIAGTTLNIATTDASNGIDNNQGLIAANQTLTASTANLDNTNGTITTAADLDLQTGALTNDAGLIQSGGNMVINTHGQALINSNSGSSKGILSQGSATLTTGALYNQTGYIGAKGAITANSTAISNNTGTVISEATIALNGISLDNQTGHVEALGNIDINTTGNIDNRTGLLRSGQMLTLTAASVENRNTQGTDATGTPTQGIEAQSVNITADQIDNSTGAMRANDMLAVIDSGTLNNSQGKLSSARALSITDRLANVNSNVAGKTLAITNTGGTIIAGTDINIDSKSLTGDGKVLSKGNLATKLTSDYTHTGELQADGNATFTTTGTLTNQAKLLAGNTLNLTAGTLNNQASGEIVGTTLHLAATDIHTLTNRGLIDGSDTFIDTVTLNNIGTGRIYGDHVAIAATTLTNDMETVNGVTSAAVIAARNRLDIGAANITNQNGALIFSAGDMAIGGSLDESHQATVAAGQPQAGAINNVSASIEALGNLTIAATALTNKRSAFSIARVLTGTRTTETWRCDNPGSCSYMSDLIYQWTDYQDVVTSNAPSASIRVGGNGTFTVGATTNEYSSILVGGDLNLVGSTLVNRGAELYQQSDYILTETQWHWGNRWQHTYTSGGSTSSLLGTEPAIISAGGNLTGTFTGSINNVSIRQHTALSGSGSGTQASAHTAGSVTQAAEGANSANVAVNQTSNAQIETVALAAQTDLASVARTVSPNTTLPNNSLFHTNPNPTAGYYVETDPQFASYRTWLSSDYMLSALALDPALTQKRLGDGFYEQKLIREQVAQLTGRRFLTGYANDEAQYQAMMNNSVTFAQAHQLVPGVALSAAQVAQLTSDIVWLVEKTVTLADGSTVQALVPQVYVRLQPGDLDSNGALLAGNNIDLNLAGDLNNNSSIAGRNIVKLSADNINNLGGRIQAGNQLALDAKNDLNVIGTTSHVDIRQRNSNNSVQQTMVNRVAGLYVTNPNGVLVASAGRDINLKAAEIINSSTRSEQAGTHGTTIIDAGNNLNLGTITETGSAYGESHGRGKKGYQRENTTQEVGTVIQADGDLSLSAGQDVTARAANVNSSNGALNVAAGNDITIEAGIATYDMEAYRKGKKSGTFSSKTSTTRDTVNDSKVISSTFSGNNVNIAAGNNLAVKASNIVGTNDVNLDAGNNVTLTTEQATHDETHFKKEKKTGFNTSGASIGYGTSKLTNTNDSQQVTNVGSTVGSVEGNVNITSGKDTKVTGSDLIAAQDINITGRNVTLDAAYDSYANQQSMKYKQSGITLGVSAPVITAIQSAQDQAKRSGEVKDDKLQALYAIKAAQNIVKAADAVQEIANSTNPAEASGVKLALSIGTSKASSNSTSTETVAKGSTLTAVRDINITATGNTPSEGEIPQGGAEAGNITMVGAAGNAGRDINLDAANDINLLSAANSSNQQSKNKSSSAGVGVAIGADKDGAGISIFANASSAKGKANGNGITHTETTLKANDTLSITSGRDTTLKGAIVGGNTVIANIGTNPDTGGNLRLESEQDSANYKSKQNSVSGGISYTFGAGGFGGSLSAGQNKVNSTYDSVIEQTAIQAGNSGFDISVAGNTHLKGAVIDSTLTAQQQNNNQLTTRTLTTENIRNKGEYTASSSSVGVSANGSPETGTNKPANGTAGSTLKGGLSGSGGTDSGEAQGTTYAAISPATVTITDDTAQQQKTGKTAAETVATLNRDTQHANGSIENPYNQQRVAEQLEFLQLASEVVLQPVAAQAAKWIGDTFPPDPNDPTKINVGKILAHATLGAAMSQLLGTGWETGAAAGALGDILPNILSKAFEKDPITGKPKNEEAFKAANVIISAALSSATGGDLAQTINAGMITQNAVANNWLNHNRPSPTQLSEKERYDQARKDCSSGNKNQCGVARELETVSKQRDLNLNLACEAGASAGCSEMARFAINDGNLLIKGTDGNIYVVSKDEPLLKSPDRPQGFEQDIAPSIIDAALQETGGYYIGKLLGVAKPLVTWATDTLGLTSKNAIVAQAQRIDELVGLFDKGNPASSVNINGKNILESANPVNSKTVKIMDSQNLTDAEIMQYAQELAGNVPLKSTANGNVFVANLGNGQQIRLRNVSSSQQQTGARWTIDIAGNKALQAKAGISDSAPRLEMKFK